MLLFIILTFIKLSTQHDMQCATTSSIVVRKSDERGHADHGWLKTRHTFNFANYYDPKYENWGSLRVINEDLVQPGEGMRR